MLNTSYSSQESPHNKELTGPKCQQCWGVEIKSKPNWWYFCKTGVLITLERNFEKRYFGKCIPVYMSHMHAYSLFLKINYLHIISCPIFLIASVIAPYYWEHLTEHLLCYIHSLSCWEAKMICILFSNTNIERYNFISIWIILSTLFWLEKLKWILPKLP